MSRTMIRRLPWSDMDLRKVFSKYGAVGTMGDFAEVRTPMVGIVSIVIDMIARKVVGNGTMCKVFQCHIF